MAANSDGYTELTTVVTCEGDLTDPRFPAQLDIVVGRLNGILGDKVKVRKLEPWNSVRVTLSIPREAALRLRQLANEGSQQLRALGILSVQVEGDQVISLRLAAGSVNSEPQEIILRTAQDGGSGDHRDTDLGLSSFLSTSSSAATNSNNSQVQFKSPNVVCPSDSVVPKVGTSTTSPNVSSSGKAFVGPFPFASMNQAIHSNRETPFNSLPPPYPGKHPPVTISSPLLVNLLQNDGPKESSNVSKLPQPIASARSIRTPPVSVHKTVTSSVAVSTTSNNSTLVKPNSTSTQANVLVNNSISPSALSINTSIRQNSTILTSTTVAVNKTPPPQYHRALPVSSAIKQQQVTGFPNASNTTSTISQVNFLAQSSSLLSQNSLPVVSQSNNTTQASLHVQQTSLFQPQTQLKNSLIQANSNLQQQNSLSTQNNVSQALSQAKVPLSQQNISLNSIMQSNMTLPQIKNHLSQSSIPISQTKNPALNNLPQTTTNSNVLSQLKHALPQGLSVAKSHNSFVSQPGKNAPSNFQQPTTLNVTLSQASTIPQPTTLSSQHSSISNSSLTNSTEPNTNPSSILSQQSILNSVISRSLPSPPPYSVAISRPWDTVVHSNSLMDLTPSITDLKPDVLDELLPTLERELSHSPLPDLPEDFLSLHSNIISAPTSATSTIEDKRKFLINPLTGELEPQSSGESDTEELKDVFTGLPSPAALSDDDTSSTTRPDPTTDQSDSEARSSDTTKPPRLKNSKIKERGRDSPALKQEKIKLRLKLEKSEPINPAYKVDVSFINTQPKKASTSMTTPGEELRVPPLHISLRGRNSVVIKNKNKLNPDGTPTKPKVRKNQEHTKLKNNDNVGVSTTNELLANTTGPAMNELTIDQMKSKVNSLEQKKFKKFKTTHDHKDIVASLSHESDLKSKFVIHNHYKEKQKERRGSDSELVRNNKKYVDSNGVSCDEKKRRLSQAEQVDEEQPAILGSTNIGTIMGLPQKMRKDKVKVKDIFKKDASRNKIFNKGIGDKLQNKQVTLPTAGEMNMEAKFKQGLLEGTGEKGVLRPPHRTEVVVNHIAIENPRIENVEKVTKTIPDPPTLKDKSPEPDKCNTPDRKSVDLTEKQTAVTCSRSPTSGAGQGEDSGIESMDALSEKSPNQASQSPHADILPPKTQVPNMLDIEAQLAKMEGLNGDTDRGGGDDADTSPAEDVNENKCHDQAAKLKQCCELTCALQDSLKQGTVSLTTSLSPAPLPAKQQEEISLVPLKVKKEDNLEPLPVRVTPALYTYSNPNPDKVRGGSESPALSDEDSNSCSTNSTMHNSKQNRSLLEQLLIEIPNDHQGVPSSPSPATRSSVRTRALSKLGSPELNSPVTKNTRTLPPTKRKRNESDSSNHSLEEARKKPRKVSETAIEPIKTRHAEPVKANSIKKSIAKVQQDESSDSDEPLIEKLRKPVNAVNTQTNNVVTKTKVKSGSGAAANNNKTVMVNTRRSVRSNMPAQNTRSKGDKIQSESEALRRKTRSAVLDVESKRKKEVK